MTCTILSRIGDLVRVDFGTHQVQAHVLSDTASVHVFHGGESFAFTLPDTLSGSEESEADDDALRAPIPGRVVKLSGKTGDRVAKGDTLAVMEAMKIELALTAPRDGEIAAAHVSVGEQVEEGALLVTLQATAD